MTLAETDALYQETIPKTITLTFSGGDVISNENICSENMSLEEALCSDDNLKYGSCESTCFCIRIAGTSGGYKGQTVQVVQSFEYEGETIQVNYGTYKVYSDKPTNDRSWRDLVCYDAMYDIIKTDVSAWFNGLTFPMTLKQMRDSLISYLGITQETRTLVNDNFQTPGNFSVDGVLSGKEVLEKICEFNGVFGHINRQGKLDYVSLPRQDSVSYAYYIDGTGSSEDYVTSAITGIVVKGESGDSGTSVGTNSNVYTILGNFLTYGTEGTAVLTTAMNNLLTKISSFTYRPFEITTYGNPEAPLGTSVQFVTRYETINSFMMFRRLNGIQLLKDTMGARGDKTYPIEVNSVKSQIIRTKGKTHILENDVNGLRSTVTEIIDDTETIQSEINQMAGEIVLKVNDNERIVKVRLGTDSSQGSAFTVDANNMNLTASNIVNILAGNELNLTSNSIRIKSTNFEVTSAGDVIMRNATVSGAISVTQGGTVGSYNIDANGNLVANFGGYSVEFSPQGVTFQSTVTEARCRLAYNGLLIGDSQNISAVIDGNKDAALRNIDCTNIECVAIDATDIQTRDFMAENLHEYHNGNAYDIFSEYNTKSGTYTASFTAGVAHIPFSSLGITSRPKAFLMTPKSGGAIVLNYMYDNSSSDIEIWGSDSSSWGIQGGGWLEGVDVKFDYFIIP